MLSHDELKSLGTLSPWHSLTDLFLAWATIGSALYLCHESLWFVPLALPLIASRLHALTVLMHDGSHYLLHPHETVNNLLSDLFCAYPLMLSTEVYRKTHWKHHQFTQTPRDPNYVIMQEEKNWHYPKPLEEAKALLWKDVFLLGLRDHLVILKTWQVLPNWKETAPHEKFLFPLFLAVVGSGVYVTGAWKEFLIFQAGAMLINPLARLRAMSEHAHYEAQGQDRIHKLEDTPTINAGELERFFISPFNTNRHLEHHLYPTIPYYNLEKAHHCLKGTATYELHCRFELDGYLLGRRTALREILVGEGYPVARKKVA